MKSKFFSLLSFSPILVLILREILRARSVDLESVKNIPSSSPSPKLGAHLREDLGETLVCAFEIAKLVALDGDCDCGFLITLGDCRHLES